MTTHGLETVPPGEDRVRVLERSTCVLWRTLEQERAERGRLEERVRLAEERIKQAEEDVKDAHDRAQGVEDRVEALEERLDRIEPEKLDPIDERELGEAGA